MFKKALVGAVVLGAAIVAATFTMAAQGPPAGGGKGGDGKGKGGGKGGDAKAAPLVQPQTVTKIKDNFYVVAGAGGNVGAAKEIGKALAERAKKAGVSAVVFDRNGFRYHGRVKAVADGAREGGLQF